MSSGKNLILFIDSGDTLVDEAAQIWGEDDTVLEAGLIEGAEAVLRRIHEQGYTISLVADGKNLSFENVYTRQYKLRSCFDAWIVSETMGYRKPDPEMFQGAMDALSLLPEDKHRIVMVGNNLGRDVLGANCFGIVSVWIDWSKRYQREPQSPNEVPDYTIHFPADLPPLLEKLEALLLKGESIKPPRL